MAVVASHILRAVVMVAAMMFLFVIFFVLFVLGRFRRLVMVSGAAIEMTFAAAHVVVHASMAEIIVAIGSYIASARRACGSGQQESQASNGQQESVECGFHVASGLVYILNTPRHRVRFTSAATGKAR